MKIQQYRTYVLTEISNHEDIDIDLKLTCSNDEKLRIDMWCKLSSQRTIKTSNNFYDLLRAKLSSVLPVNQYPINVVLTIRPVVDGVQKSYQYVIPNDIGKNINSILDVESMIDTTGNTLVKRKSDGANIVFDGTTNATIRCITKNLHQVQSAWLQIGIRNNRNVELTESKVHI